MPAQRRQNEEDNVANSDSPRPELIIGIVAAVGIPIELAIRLVEEALEKFGYAAETLHLSQYTDYFRLENPEIDRNASFADRLDAAMQLGTEVRKNRPR